MRRDGNIPTALGLIAVCCLAFVVIFAVGCKKETAKTPQTTTPAEMVQKSQAAGFVNVRCPIMGTTIDPANVSDSLTRTHKGNKVAFCCAGCPATWDKLSDAEKDAKLAKVVLTQGD
ncbi:MAG: hypothetical protein HQ546_05740 [Planctomycetes bacterium]|nr:hypothetical protein [Planctomycetota bacterium]